MTYTWLPTLKTRETKAVEVKQCILIQSPWVKDGKESQDACWRPEWAAHRPGPSSSAERVSPSLGLAGSPLSLYCVCPTLGQELPPTSSQPRTPIPWGLSDEQCIHGSWSVKVVPLCSDLSGCPRMRPSLPRNTRGKGSFPPLGQLNCNCLY